MKKKFDYFIPKTAGGLMFWSANIYQKLPVVGPLVGLTPAQVTTLSDAAQAIIDALNKVQTKKSELQEAVLARDLSLDNDLQILKDAIAAMKTNPLYTENLGGELGIVSTSQIINPDTIKPEIQLVSVSGAIKVFFNKKGMLGVNIYSRIKGAPNWTLLSAESQSPYIDNRALEVPNKAELREYMVICRDIKQELGQQSQIESISFGGGALNNSSL
jgi:hypothetical protein